jgi:hypothetical protein
MSALFPRWANTVVRVVLLGAALTLVVVPVTLMAWVRTPNATNRGRTLAQPVPFSHQLHAGDFHIDCRYCHATVERTATAGIPPTATCVPCHTTAWMNSPQFTAVRHSLATGRPIAWQRVDRLPGFVYFDHSVHVSKGIGCESCHGRVDRMAQVVQAAPLTMAWCLSCHRDPAAHLRPTDQITTMGYVPPISQAALGPELQKRYHVHQYTTCTACHR